MTKHKEKFHQNSATVKQPKADSEQSKKLLSHFKVEHLYDRKQIKAELKNRVAQKKCISEKFSIL